MNEQYGLTVENLLNVLPDVLRQDEKMLALATGVAEILTARPAEIEQNMLASRITIASLTLTSDRSTTISARSCRSSKLSAVRARCWTVFVQFPSVS